MCYLGQLGRTGRRGEADEQKSAASFDETFSSRECWHQIDVLIQAQDIAHDCFCEIFDLHISRTMHDALDQRMQTKSDSVSRAQAGSIVTCTARQSLVQWRQGVPVENKSL